MIVLEERRYFKAGWIPVTPPARASLCDLISTVTVRRSRAYCDGTAAAATWGKAYIQGQITHSGASLLVVGRCKNCIGRNWRWGRFWPRILGLALLGRR